MKGLSWPPSGPLPPGDGLAASCVDTRRLLRPPPRAASHHHSVLTPPRAGATAAHGSTAPRAASRRDPSVQRPWPVAVPASFAAQPCSVGCPLSERSVWLSATAQTPCALTFRASSLRGIAPSRFHAGSRAL